METRDGQFETIFAELIRTRLGLYRSISVGIVNSPADADDAVQAALCKAWRKRFAFRSDFAALSGWVSRIVVTESYDLLRRRMRERKTLEGYEPEENAENPAVALLDRAIAELPPLYREAIHVAVLSGLDGESAARELECSPNTLYQRVHKAKRLLKETIGRLEHE